MDRKRRTLPARILAWVLSAAMAFTVLPSTTITSYAASDIVVDFDVTASTTISGKVGDTGSIDYRATLNGTDITDFPDLSIAFESGDSEIVSVDSDGKYILEKTGSAYITMTVNYPNEQTVHKRIDVNVEDNDFSLELDSSYAQTIQAKVYDKGVIGAQALLNNSVAQNASIGFVSSDTDIVWVTSDGRYECLKAGRAVITVTAECTIGSTDYKEEKKVEIVVSEADKPGITLSGDRFDIEITDDDAEPTFNLNEVVSTANTDEAVVFTVDANTAAGLAATEKNGIVKFKQAGVVRVKVAVTGVEKWITFYVIDKTSDASTVTLAAGETKLEVGKTTVITPTVTGGEYTKADLTWASDNEAVATVSLVGDVVAVGKGFANITATLPNENLASVLIEVVETTVVPEPEISVTQDAFDIDMGTETEKKFELTSVITFKNVEDMSKVAYSISGVNDGVAITESELTFTKAGTYYLKVTAGSASANIVFHVMKTDVAPEAVISRKTTDNVEMTAEGESFDCKTDLEITNASISDVSWSSSDTEVVGVTNGVIVAKAEGTAVVTAALTNGAYVTWTVVVNIPEEMPEPEISVTQDAFDIDMGTETEKKFELTSVITFKNVQDMSKVAYSISGVNDGVVIDGSELTFTKAGTYYLKVTAGSASANIVFHVTKTDVAPEAVISRKTTDNVEMTAEGESFDCKTDLEITNASISDVSWSSSDTEVVGVTNGVIVAKAEGTAVVTAALTNGAYVTWTVVVKIPEEIPAPVIRASKDEFDIDMGVEASVEFNLKSVLKIENGTFDDVSYQISSGIGSATVEDGVVTFRKAGYYYITAIITNAQGSASADLVFHVTKTVGTSDITITGGEDVSLEEIGAALDVSDKVEVTNGTLADVTWNSSNPDVAAVSNGVIVAKAEGTAVVTATVASGSYANFVVTVKDSRPVITASHTEFDIDLGVADSKTFNLASVLNVINAEESDISYVFSDASATVEFGVAIFTKPGYYLLKASVENEKGSDSVYLVFHVTKTVDADDMKVEGGEDLHFTVIGQAADVNEKVTVTNGSISDLSWNSSNPDVATVTNGVIVAKAEGTAVITATLSNGNYVNFTVYVEPVGMTAKVTEFHVDLKDIENDTYDLSTLLTVTNGDKENNVYSDFNPEILTVDENGIVSFKGNTGVTYVRAQNEKAYVIFTFYVTDTTEPDPIAVQYTADAEKVIELQEGKAYEPNLREYVEVSGGDIADIIWSVDDASVAEITDGVVKAVKAGTAVVTASTKDGYYVTFTILVKANVSLTADITEFNIDLKEQKEVDLDAYLNLENAGIYTLDSVSCTSSSDEIASVDGRRVTFKSVGTVHVKAELDGQKVLFTFHVIDSTDPNPVTIQYTDNAEKVIEIFEGEAYDPNLREYVEISEGDITDIIWSVDDENTAAVTDGVVKGIKAGTAVVTAATKNGYYVTFTVIVKEDTKLTADKKEFDIDLKTQKTFDLKTYLKLENPNGATLDDVEYTSVSEEMATVSEGTVSFKSVGTIEVRAELGVQTVLFTFHVIDTTEPDPVTIQYTDSAEKKIEIPEGELYPTNLRDYVEVTNGDITDIIWSSADESIAVVADGVVKGISAGNTVVTASTADGYYVTFEVTVKASMKLTAARTDFDIDLKEQKELDLDAYLNLENAGNYTLKQVICTSSAEEIATVTEHIVAFQSVGTVHVKAELDGQMVLFTFHVIDTTEPEPVMIQYTDNAVKVIEITEGEAYDPNLREYVEISEGDITDIIWTVNKDEVATVTDGVVEGVAPGTAVVTAATKDGYYVTFTIIVKEAVAANVVLTGENVVNLILDGKANAVKDLSGLVASTTDPNADVKGFAWSSADESIVVAANGTVKAVSTGQTIVSVTAPDGSSVQFIVSVSAGTFIDMDSFDGSQIVLQLDVTDKESKELPKVTVDGGSVRWTVLDESVAAIAGDNLIQAVREGLTAAVATAPDGSTFAVSVKVLSAPKVTIEGVNETIALKLEGKETEDLWQHITVTLSGALDDTQPVNPNDKALRDQITWTSSDEGIVAVIGGVAVAKAAGTAIVTASAPDGTMVIFTVTVDAADVSGVALKDGESRVINLTLDSADNSYKDLSKLVEDTCTAISADPATFNWTTADASVATVTDGVVYAQGKGNTTVTVTAPDGTKVTFIVAVAQGGFTEESLDIEWEAVLQIGGTESKILPDVKAVAGNVTWNSEDPAIAKIVGNSVVAVGEGVTYVTATAPNGSKLAFLVTVYGKTTLAFDKTMAEVVTDETVQAGVIANPEDAQVAYTVTQDGQEASENTDYILIVNNDGISFTPLKAGKFVITGTTTVNEITATAKLIVTALQDVESVAFTEESIVLYTGNTEDLASLIQWNGGNSVPYNTELIWTSGDETIASVDETGIVKAVKQGTAYIYAAAYNSLRAKIKVNVKQSVTGVELSNTGYELWKGQTAFISAKPVPATAEYTNITFESEDSSIATVDEEGKITAVSGGSTYIKATVTWVDEKGKNQTVSERASVLVKAPVETVEIRRVDTDSAETIYAKQIGETIQLKTVITPQNAYDKTIIWGTEDESVATVDESGLVTATGKGATYVYAKCLSDGYGCDGYGTPAVGMIQIVVGGDKISLSVTPERSEVYPGASITFETELSPEKAVEGEVTWTSDNEYVTVDSKGVATVAEGAQAGLAKITAAMKMVDGSTYTAEALIYIKTPVQSIDFSKDKMTIYLNEDDNLTPIFNGGKTVPANTKIEWTVVDASILSVDGYGKIHAKKLGSTWVYATAYNGMRAEIYVKVIAAPKAISLDKHQITCWAGERQSINYSFTPSYTTETAVTWTTSNSKVAFYNTYTKKIVPVGSGSCYITVTASDKHFGVISDKVRVTVKQRTTGVVMSKKKLTKKVGKMFRLKATVQPADAYNKVIYWTSSKPSVATVDEFGIVTCLKKGTTTITAISADGYTAKCKLKVKAGKKKKSEVMYGVTNVDNLFIRNEASLQGLQLGQFARGSSVTIVDTVGEWYKIQYNGGYAYVRSSYVTITSGGSTETVIKSNGKISRTTWIYTGPGYGANTVAPTGTKVLITGRSGSYYQIRYGTGSLGTGYVLINCVSADSGFRYGVSTQSVKKNQKASSTPQVTLYRTAKTKKRIYIYKDATGKGKRIGRLMKNTKLILNSQRINGFYQVVFTNGMTGYVKCTNLKVLKKKVKTNVNTTNTYVKAFK